MKFFKLLLTIFLLGLGGVLFFWAFGFLASLFFYVFAGALLVGGGILIYSLFSSDEMDEEPHALNEKVPTGIGEFEGTNRLLEKYKEEARSEKRGD